MGIEIKITKLGVLKMLRRGKWMALSCPFVRDGSHCGDWCPLFYYKETVMPGPGCEGDATLRELFLCRTKYLIKKIDDE